MFFIALLITVIMVYTVISAVNTNRTFTSSGRINASYNIGVYSDSACTQNLAAIDWGTITAGTSTAYSFYVKNIGSARQNLTLTTNAWTPTSAAQYITITWDRNNATLTANQVLQATLNLTVLATIDSSITTFSNNITITGTS